MKPFRGDQILTAFLVVCVVAFAYIVTDSMREKITEAGDMAPSFKIKTDSGRTMTPTDFGGRILVLNFWATWCQPCVEETPSLMLLSNRLRDKGVVVMGVSIDTDEAAYRRFIQRFGLKFETARDPESNVSAEYGTFKVPETYIINREGKVVEKIIGPKDWSDPAAIRSIEKLL